MEIDAQRAESLGRTRAHLTTARRLARNLSSERETFALGRYPGARELALALTNLEQAEMWLARGIAVAEQPEGV